MTRIQLTTWTQAKSLALPIRLEVFVQEQKVPIEMEMDEFDEIAMHLIFSQQEVAVGTARIYKETWNNEACFRIGRLSILKAYRGQGFGHQMMQALIQYAQKNGDLTIILHAQVEALAFYKKLGFEAIGSIFEEAGIPHQICQRSKHTSLD